MAVLQLTRTILNVATSHQLQAKLMGVATVATAPIMKETQIFNCLPSDVDALIIFKRYFIDHTLDAHKFTGNYCVECMILHKGRQEYHHYTNVMFAVGCVALYVGRSKTNIVISLLKKLIGESILSQVTGNILSQVSHYTPYTSNTNNDRPFSERGYGI
jgi:hypothetical protein